MDLWPETFYVFTVIFIIIKIKVFFTLCFFILGILCLIYLIKNIYKGQKFNHLSKFRFFLVFIMVPILINNQSPVNLSMLIIIIICAIQVFWLQLDPFLVRGYLHRSGERLLNEVSYSLLLSAFSIILFVWYSIYEELIFETSDKIKNTKK